MYFLIFPRITYVTALPFLYDTVLLLVKFAEFSVYYFFYLQSYTARYIFYWTATK